MSLNERPWLCYIKANLLKQLKCIKDPRQEIYFIQLWAQNGIIQLIEEQVGCGIKVVYTLLSIGFQIPLLNILIQIKSQGPFFTLVWPSQNLWDNFVSPSLETAGFSVWGIKK